MSRREHYQDPAAPKANSIVVAATAFVLDDEHRVLLVRRSDNGLWALPGGAMDVGERVAQTAERETLEETGYVVEVTDLIGVYSDPAHVMAYDNGEVRQQFALSFRARFVGGSLRTSAESPEVVWVSERAADALDVHPSIRLRLAHGFEVGAEPHLG